ncbi:RNA polymerase sigma factor [Lentisalinibacter orientalis]|uniref:RNA polymerase sigma factor n=1 Tax=Lentisalinibacter orientalis TaxID=2992241 RepID=UPI00386F9D5E
MFQESQLESPQEVGGQSHPCDGFGHRDVCRQEYIVGACSFYGKRLYQYFKSRGYPVEDCEDLVQETLCRLCTVEDVREIRNLEAFLFTTAYRLSVDWIRKEHRLPGKNLVHVDPDEAGSEEARSEDYCVALEQLRFVTAKIRALPAQRKKVLMLRKLGEMSYQDIADEMGITIGSVRKHLSAAVKDCRDHLASYQ